MTISRLFGNVLATAITALVAALLLVPIASAEPGPVIALPAADAEALKLLGEGVVGKAIPAPPLGDLQAWYMGDASGGEWTYHVIKGKKKAMRVESITPAPERGGQKAWTQKIGNEFIQEMQVHVGGALGKYTETDVEMSYVTHFHPGILLAPGLAPGKTFEAKQKALVYKVGHPDKTAYTGSMDVKLTYVGAYEVTTPAGMFPSVLMRAEFDIKVGPATVKDVQYSFFSKGVGKVAEIEALKVSALLIYHSNDKTAKVLAKKPKR
jgi:hypothetical protein